MPTYRVRGGQGTSKTRIDRKSFAEIFGKFQKLVMPRGCVQHEMNEGFALKLNKGKVVQGCLGHGSTFANDSQGDGMRMKDQQHASEIGTFCFGKEKLSNKRTL